jgi:hypothetical protein
LLGQLDEGLANIRMGLGTSMKKSQLPSTTLPARLDLAFSGQLSGEALRTAVVGLRTRDPLGQEVLAIDSETTKAAFEVADEAVKVMPEWRHARFIHMGSAVRMTALAADPANPDRDVSTARRYAQIARESCDVLESMGGLMPSEQETCSTIRGPLYDFN